MPRPRPLNRVLAVLVLVVGAALPLAMQTSGAAATLHRGAAAARRGVVSPRTVGELDCNGFSPIQRSARPGMLCADPHGDNGGRFEDNGHYIGHDEPSIRLVSNQPGSGDNMTMVERLPVDPAALPTVSHPGTDVTHFFELSVAPWISIDVCDPNSAPLLPCTPESDANAPHGRYPGAGAAFVELQFYPPGFAPFDDNISCDNSHWCSALTIDSADCAGSGLNVGPCNPNCEEPVNFGFIQMNGVPTGPPSPQRSDFKSFTPNDQTLLMNPGDRISVHMFDAQVPGGHALEARETDLTTGQSGFMIASAANGFTTTSFLTCKGTPFNYQPEYSSAAAGNLLPWGIGPYMINDQFEIGHFEPCTTITGPVAIQLNARITDTFYKRCHGPYEQAEDTGKDFEPNDSPCYPFGDTHSGLAQPNLVTGCEVAFGAIGDLDYDGTSYYPDWPNSTTPDAFPSTFEQQEPTSVGGHTYPQIQFVTDSSATQFNTHCNLVDGHGCVLPPKGPGHFYPYWTLAKVTGQCVWEFGNMTNGNTFGGDRQYGAVTPGTLGAFASRVRTNPSC